MHIFFLSNFFFCIYAHLFIIVKSGNDQQHTAYGTLLNLTYRMPSWIVTICLRKINGHMSHASDLIVAASTGGFTNMLTSSKTKQNKAKQNKNNNNNKTCNTTNCLYYKLPLFRYTSIFSTFSGPELSGEHGNEPGDQVNENS